MNDLAMNDVAARSTEAAHAVLRAANIDSKKQKRRRTHESLVHESSPHPSRDRGDNRGKEADRGGMKGRLLRFLGGLLAQYFLRTKSKHRRDVFECRNSLLEQ